MLYQVEEARRYSVNVGFGAELGRIGTGVTTFDAPAGSAGFAPRVSLGVTRNNVFGLGHTVSLQSRFSSLQQRATLSYFAPQVKGNESLNLTFIALYDDSRDVRNMNPSAWRDRFSSAKSSAAQIRFSTGSHTATYMSPRSR